MSSSGTPGAARGARLATRLAHLGRPSGPGRAINPGLSRGSTLLFDSTQALYDTGHQTYGRDGLEAQKALEQVLCEIQGAAGCTLTPSGVSAISLAIQAVVQAGEHVLVVDCAYGPTRTFCNKHLARFGVETTYVGPRADLTEWEQARRPNTRAIVLESPGSLTFELQDVRGLSAWAHQLGLLTIVDDTWSAGVHFDAISAGADIVIQALTKYQSGGSDAFGGAVLAANDNLHKTIRACQKALGLRLGADDAWLILRGIRSLTTRMHAQDTSARQVAAWLGAQPWVARALHPAFPSHPDHALWAKEFTGAAGLFGVVLRGQNQQAAEQAVERLQLFGMGYSWGGFESLAIPCDRQLVRNFKPKEITGPLIRLSIGLEDPQDLIADLAQAFDGYMQD